MAIIHKNKIFYLPIRLNCKLFVIVTVAPRTEYIAAVAVDTSSIIRFDRLRPRLIEPIDLPGSSDPSALTFDPIESYFYYTDVQEKFIARVKEDGSESTILVQDAIDGMYFRRLLLIKYYFPR